MPEIRLSDLRGGYIQLVDWVATNGREVSPRGQLTSEIEGALVVLENPFDALPVGVGRGVSLGIAAVEACQLLAGVTTPQLVVDIGPIFENYREDNGEFHGAYGPRTKGQFAKMVERLKADPDTRQAVTTIWDKHFDLMERKRDYPCTLSFTFHIRRDKLNMRVHMRSNDVIKGVGYDFFQFTRVQIAMASVLGIAPGEYWHYADSMHLYHSDMTLAGQLRVALEHPKLPPVFTGHTWADVASQASAALNAAMLPQVPRDALSPTARWHAEAMIRAVSRHSDTAASNE